MKKMPKDVMRVQRPVSFVSQVSQTTLASWGLWRYGWNEEWMKYMREWPQPGNLFGDFRNKYHPPFLHSLVFCHNHFLQVWNKLICCMTSNFSELFQAAKENNTTRKFPCNSASHRGPSLALPAQLCCGTRHVDRAPVSTWTSQWGTQTEVPLAFPQSSHFYNTQFKKIAPRCFIFEITQAHRFNIYTFLNF